MWSRRAVTLLLVAATIAVGCGGDDDAVEVGSSVTVTGPDTPVSSSAGSGTATTVLPTRQRVEPRAGMENERPVAFDPSTATEVEGGVLVPFLGGVEPCSVLGRAEAVETADTVTIALFAGADPDAGDTACIEIAVEYEVVVPLAQPLGNRTVVDAAPG